MLLAGDLVIALIQGGAKLKTLLFEGGDVVCCCLLLKYLINSNKPKFALLMTLN